MKKQIFRYVGTTLVGIGAVGLACNLFIRETEWPAILAALLCAAAGLAVLHCARRAG